MSHPQDLLLIIDPQNVYTPQNEWGCQSFDHALSNILTLLQSEKCPSVLITQFLSNPDATGVWAQYNRENASINANAYLNELVPELKPWAERYPVITKSLYSSFSAPAVAQAAARADRVVLTGVVAECCVLATALAAIDAGCKVVYLTDAVSGLTPENESMTERILATFAPLHAELMTTAEYLRS